jgi:hypothetical protein
VVVSVMVHSGNQCDGYIYIAMMIALS